MTYQVPGGWVETFTQYEGFRKKLVFHENHDCPKIREHRLQAVARPGSAARCPMCSRAA